MASWKSVSLALNLQRVSQSLFVTFVKVVNVSSALI